MKWTVLLLAASALSQAQQFSTGQAARLVIGQSPYTAQDPGASDKLLGSVGGAAFANDTLVVADSNGIGGTPINHRVLVYRNVSAFIPDRKAPIPQISGACPVCVGAATNVLGQPDFSATELKPAAQNTVRKPVGVAFNGRSVAVADTDNNRVLVWRSLPTANQQPADFVVGQKDFTSYTTATGGGLSASTLRGPEGVYLDANNGLWVADTGNNRVLYYGEVSQNGQSAKLVLGQSDFGVNQQRGLFPNFVVKADTMLNPTSVSGDGTHLIVTDLAFNRVLIWNAIPTRNGQPADVVAGQAEMTNSTPNDSSKLCASNGTDKDGKATYPARCGATMELPRAAISDGRRLFVADGGNDRVLVWNEIPRANGVPADFVLGQPSLELNQASDSAEPERISSTDSFRTPVSLAWDAVNQNLYVADTYNRRVLVYTPGDFPLPMTAVRNAASPEVYAGGSVSFSGTIEEKYDLSIKIGNNSVKKADGTVADPKEYKITTVKADTFDTIIDKFAALINEGAGDPYVLAIPNKVIQSIRLTSRLGGLPGNEISMATAISPDTAKVVLTVSGATLTGGQNASRIAPYAIVTVLGDNLADETTPVQDLSKPLPTELGGVEFYVDGIKAPLVGVSPSRVLAQIPIEATDRSSSSGILRVRRKSGAITVSTPVAIPIIAQNPAVYNDPGLQPSPGLAYHSSSQAMATVSVDGAPKGGDVATISIRGREYSYTVQTIDTLAIVRDRLIALINASDPEVEAYSAGPFQRIRLRALVPGPEGNGIPISAKANTDAQVIMSAFNSALCCANEAGAPVTEANPATPGETIVVLAGGLGLVGPDEAREAMKNGQPYSGPMINDPTEFVAALAGGKTANVLFAGLRRGLVGVYEVHLELNPDLPTNPKTEATIAQSFQVSNIFTFPVLNTKSVD
ncbi:MAG: hypothetical protein HY858_12575 [Candidatus Solibacter usitatus]|nr:hypothetical protein [Candidatus Solibacter usitatus]